MSMFYKEFEKLIVDSELFQGFVKTGNLEDDNTVVQAGFYRSFRTIRHQRFYGSD